MIVVSTEIPAPRERVWADIARLDSHSQWMADAYAIEFRTEQTEGPGTVIDVETRVGPLRTHDLIEVVAWDPPARIGVRHTGLFTGSGEFLLERAGSNATRFTWREDIRFPWYFAGPIGAWAAAPVLRAIWKRNLRRLADRFR
jgi:carbon monoxide dehydrogenase subunit G